MTKKKTSMRPPLTGRQLVRGWPGQGGTRIRLARAGDTGAVAELLALADVTLGPDVAELIEASTVTSTLLTGLHRGTRCWP